MSQSTTNTITSLSNEPTMREFFDFNKIPYCVVRHVVEEVDGVIKKTMVGAPPAGWVKHSYETMMAINEDRQTTGATTLVANLRNSPFCVLDADSSEAEQYLIDTYPNTHNFSESVSKNMTHLYLLKHTEDTTGKNKTGYKKDLDLIYDIIFEKLDGPMYAYDPKKFIVFDDYKNTVSLPTDTPATNLSPKDRVFDPTILDIISRDYFGKTGDGSYSDWRNICFSCLYSWGVDDGRDICLKYSYHDDYPAAETEAAIDDLIKGYNPEKSPQFGTLCNYAKISNQELFSKWYRDTYFPALPRNFRDMALSLLRSEFKDKIVSCNSQIYLTKPNEPVFVSGKDKITSALYKHVCNNVDMYRYVEVNSKGEEYIRETDKVSTTNDVIKYITENTPVDDEFLNKMIQENKERIWFNDGYYNSTINQFVKTTTERTGIYIDRPMCSVSNGAVREAIREKILLKLFNCRADLADYYLYALRLALECKVSIKKFYEITGKRDCGKSILIKMLESCFGGYVSVLSISNFYIKKGDSESRDLGFLLQTPFARVWILNENMPKKVLNGSIIKSLCSGGDQMRVRALYKEESVISPMGTLFMYANHQLAVEPLDTNEKKISITLHNKFVSPGAKQIYSNVTYYEADHTIDDYIKQQDVIDEFTLMILTAKPCSYPQDLLEAEEDDVEDNMSTTLLNDFVYSKGSILTRHAIKKYLKESDLGIKPKELRHLLMGLISGIEVHKDKNYNVTLYNITCIADDGVDES